MMNSPPPPLFVRFFDGGLTAVTQPPPRRGHTMTSLHPIGTPVVFGGREGTSKGSMISVEIPSDWCQLQSRHLCTKFSGCFWCDVDSVCTSVSTGSNCTINEAKNALTCSVQDCSQRLTCSDCVNAKVGNQACTWCR